MGILGTVREFLAAAGTDRRTDGSTGAYWCHDCGERVREADHGGEAPPACPDCGDPMTFERSVGSSGCAC